MLPALFISDLHLHESRPHINGLFEQFLTTHASKAEALYILGDLFEFWVGDDQLAHEKLAAAVSNQLRQLARSGVRIFLLHGNRDFLIGEQFAHESGLSLIEDPTLLDLQGTRLLLMHGDTLCTDDVAYQHFRLQARNPAWQQAALAQPYDKRIAQAQSMRMQSDSAKTGKSETIMDVTLSTVRQVFEQYAYPILLHGHTHRPGHHVYEINGNHCERWVLPDWYETAGYISLSGGRLTAHSLLPLST